MEKSFLIGSCRRFANFRFRRIGAEAFENDFFAGSPRRFPHFRVRRAGPEKFFLQKSYGIWPLLGRSVNFSGRLMTGPERFFGGSPMPFAHFRVHTPCGI